MLTAQMVKDFCLNELGVDKVGIANIERFKDAPADMSPTAIMPQARSVIVFIKRIPRGCYRGIEEGTHWASYTIFGYLGINRMTNAASYKLSRFVEHHGYEGVPLFSCSTSRELGPRGNKIPGKPRRDVSIHHRIAATLAGLGEIGWSKVFLTEEFGPRQRIGLILTDAVLEPDPMVIGTVCDRCKRCVADCPGALPKDKSVKIEVEGQTIEWSDIDIGKCKFIHFGLDRRISPFLVKRFPGLYMPAEEQETTWLESHDIGFLFFPSMPTLNALMQHERYLAVCGARGCIRACMKHLEQRDRVRNKFESGVFETKKPWMLDARPPHVEHHGFVYDPDEDDEKDVEFHGVPTWY
jgi:ferredoxin